MKVVPKAYQGSSHLIPILLVVFACLDQCFSDADHSDLSLAEFKETCMASSSGGWLANAQGFDCDMLRKKAQHLENIKAQILYALDIVNPNYTIPSSKIDAAQALLPQIVVTPKRRRSVRGPRRPTAKSGANISHRLLYGLSAHPNETWQSDKLRTYFVVQPTYRINRATLWVYIRRPTTSAPTVAISVNVTVYKFLSPTDVDYLTMQEITFTNDGDWLNFDVTHLAIKWSNEPHRNFGLMIKSHYPNTHEDLICRHRDPHHKCNASEEIKQIVMEMDVTERAAPQARRVVRGVDCNESAHGPRNCCRHHLEVNFQKIGWNWILEPKALNTYFCGGQCPLSTKLAKNDVTLINMHMAKQLNRDLGVCCTPHHLTEIDLVYFDEAGTLHKQQVKNAVVESCICA